jgi:hypothetical protein
MTLLVNDLIFNKLTDIGVTNSISPINLKGHQWLPQIRF